MAVGPFPNRGPRRDPGTIGHTAPPGGKGQVTEVGGPVVYPLPDCIEPTYFPAKWKNIAFVCEATADEVGRRGQLYEYPLSEDVGFKDLGRKARRFQVEGYLVGSEQVALSVRMARAAESPEPGQLIHPIFGEQLVSCVTLKMSADYKRDIKRTKLAFEFIEAHTSLAPFTAGGGSLFQVFKTGSDAVDVSKTSGAQRWTPSSGATKAATDVSNMLAKMIAPPKDEESFDAQSALKRGAPAVDAVPPTTTPVATVFAFTDVIVSPINPYQTFADVSLPIDIGTATIRRIHETALARLREFNHYVVTTLTERTPSIDALLITARLALVRDYAVVVAQATYKTVHAALKDLDFVVAVYDEEELAATAICHDGLVRAIRTARATAISAILVRNIRLPGIVYKGVDGVWPSLVVAHKLYFDGRRHEEVENYNPDQIPFFVGRNVTAPAY